MQLKDRNMKATTAIKFGTGGWRAIIGDTFIKENIRLVGEALAIKMEREGVADRGIVLGFDKRFLSDKSARWLAEVFAAHKIKVYFIDKVSPTPLIMFGVKSLATPYGIAVTASHNPADYNGLKVFTEGGKDADIDVTEGIESIIAEGIEAKVMDYTLGLAQGLIERYNPMNSYMDTILGMLNVVAIRDQELKILLDPMYGVSKTALSTLLMSARCEVDTIHDGHDTNFGGRMPSPSEETLSHLKSRVVEQGYDMGIGTDGDADRLGIIDETGAYIHPNKIMVLLYYYMLAYKGLKGDVVRNIATTHQLDRIAEAYGQTCHEVPVGFKHISSMMAQTEAIIGGESSGGLTIKGHVKGKDGIFAAGLLVEMVSVTGLKLHALLNKIDGDFGSFYMVEGNHSFDHDVKAKLYEQLYVRKEVPDFEDIDHVSYMDGVKIYFKSGDWIIGRFSGTEPLIRIFAESSSKEQAESYLRGMTEFLGL